MSQPQAFAGTSRFRVLRQLGQGGMGVVYEAFDQEQNQKVALKTLLSLSPDALFRFKTEFRDFQNLSHPNLVSLGELFNDADAWFFTMELVNGCSFLEWVRGEKSNRSPQVNGSDDTVTSDPALMESSHVLSIPATHENFLPLPGQVDEARLRESVSQLVRGLMALHEQGKLHRDVKSSNVLVTHEGRVVLLDFGLALDTQLSMDQRALQEVVGTIAYMAPEQAAGRTAGPASDLYAVGVMLFEALTGYLPFVGSGMRVMFDKQRESAPSVLRFNPGVSSDLSDLVSRLLHYEPSQRPVAMEVLEALNARVVTKARMQSMQSFSGDAGFVGRESELEALERSMNSVREGQCRWAVLSGESGLGKTALAKHFVQQLQRKVDDAVVLKSVCYEREAVPYKAIDGAIDSLSKRLALMKKEEVAGMLPRHIGLLTQFFPVLGRVSAVLEAPQVKLDTNDPVEHRRIFFEALRELLQRMGDRRPVVLWIDDIQWSDTDSWVLLSEVFRPGLAPKIMVLCTLRADDEPTRAALAEKVYKVTGEYPLNLALNRLTQEQSLHLAKETLVRLSMDPSQAASLALESQGHPLFLDALIRYQEFREPGKPLSLDEALLAVVDSLDATSQNIVQLVASTSVPLTQETIARAAGVEFGVFFRASSALCVSHVVRTAGKRRSDTIEPYHDRVRVAVRKRLNKEAEQELHRKLAVALESESGGDAELLTYHWMNAGERARAARYAESAARRAGEMHAFDRAAHYVELCLEYGTNSPAQEAQLKIQLAEVLSNAGRGPEAAEVFLEAAQKAGVNERWELKRRAADQLLRAGHFERGVQVMNQVLNTVGLKLTTKPWTALLGLLWSRLRLALTPLRVRKPWFWVDRAKQLLKVDATSSVGVGLANVDTIQGASFQARSLIEALSCGDPTRAGRALLNEAGFQSTQGIKNYAKAMSLWTTAQHWLEEAGDEKDRDFALFVRGMIAFQSSKFAEALPYLKEGHSRLSKVSTARSWELDMSLLFLGMTQYMMGEVRDLPEVIVAATKDADLRNDQYLSSHLKLTHFTALRLFRGRVQQAMSEVETASRVWKHSGFLAQNYYHAISVINLGLYGAMPLPNCDWVGELLDNMKKSFLDRVEVLRLESLYLATLVVARHPEDPRSAAWLRKWQRRMSQEKAPPAAGYAQVIDAVLSFQVGDLRTTSAKCQSAAEAFGRCQMVLHQRAAEHAHRKLENDEQGAKASLAALGALGLGEPERVVALYHPQFAKRDVPAVA